MNDGKGKSQHNERPRFARRDDAAPPGKDKEKDGSLRLAKQVATMRGCSRREAELLIEQGAVRVDGQRIEVAGQRVQPQQRIEVDAEAQPTWIAPVTLLFYKAAGQPFDAPPERLLAMAKHSASDRSRQPTLRRHFVEQQCFTPLERAASGLLVFTQEMRVARKLREDAALIENELMVDVHGTVSPEALHRLNQAPVIDGRAMLPARVSIGREADGITGLRFAVKGSWPGQIAQMCDACGLQIQAMRRIRIGRLVLAGLAPGEWRFMSEQERV